MVRIVAFAKATPEEHLAPEPLLLLLLLLGRAIQSHPHAESHRESLRSTTGWSDSVQISRLRFCPESTQNRARIEGRIAYCDRPYCCFRLCGATTRSSAHAIESVAGVECLAVDGYKKMLKRMLLSPSSSFRHPAQCHRSDLGLYGRPGKIRVASAIRNQIAAMLLFLRLFTALG